ncbi:unnamed protein product [Didymodactylos carnosus]|uniref:Uncharacterized protein n=1 Tax=Didymodactylos carnosus TaxID=1234261 RepID=A0A8S2FBW1_9BILA|nr:unnamed protein product [Didymodactylos carnosus]CAF4219295.1 unnamed protein product [Didymodactylos carnosus]
MYTVVRINNHEPLKDRYKHENETPLSDADVGKRWLKKCDGGGRLQKQSAEKSTLNLQYTVTNGPYTNAPSNPVLQAFVNAYNNHEDLILCPDDIWLVICISYAQYVNANAEKLRHIFVDHQGKKELTVFEPPGKDERDWTDFFGAMKQEIEQNVKGDIVSVLTANYSTTGKVEAILSNACIMDTFQSYFEYTRVMTMCGIRNVKFMGTLDDWKMLKNKTEQMKAYSEDIKSTHGSGACTYISGWILRLFYSVCSQNRCDYHDIELNSIKVPVKVVNESTGTEKMCSVIGGFHGVNREDHAYKPVMSLAVVEDLSTVKPMKS